MVDTPLLPLLKSALLDAVPHVTHGFTTRQGGDSQGPYASLNLGSLTEDNRTTVEANRQRVLTALGKTGASWVSLKQVHGDKVHEVTNLAGRTIEGDALWTRDRQAAIAVLTADCVPILLADMSARGVAAVHAGWRGTASQVVVKTVARLKDAGLQAARLVVAIGPAIGPCCFTIGADVAQQLKAAIPAAPAEAIRPGTGEAWVADLWALNRTLLVESGVSPENIDTLAVCTKCTSSLYSHRRDQGVTGRQAGVIALTKPIS